MVKTWIAKIDPLYDEAVYQRYYKSVPKERQEKANRILKKEDKLLSIGVWVLLMEARKDVGAATDAVFNLSHSGCYVLCSIADGQIPDVRVGCDIECVKELRMNVAERFFSEGERVFIRNCRTEESKKQAFYRYWVLKESFMKATRRGMALPLNSFEVEIQENGKAELITQPLEIKERYYFKEYFPDNHEFKVAVCSTDPKFSYDVKEVKL